MQGFLQQTLPCPQQGLQNLYLCCKPNGYGEEQCNLRGRPCTRKEHMRRLGKTTGHWEALANRSSHQYQTLIEHAQLGIAYLHQSIGVLNAKLVGNQYMGQAEWKLAKGCDIANLVRRHDNWREIQT